MKLYLAYLGTKNPFGMHVTYTKTYNFMHIYGSLKPDFVQTIICLTLETLPEGTRRNNNVTITSKRRRFDVIMTLLLRHMSTG